MTPKELQKLKELCEKATPGPWEWHVDLERRFVPRAIVSNEDYEICETNRDQNHGDYQFIAASREAVPKLIAENEKLTSLLHERKLEIEKLHKEKVEYKAEVERQKASKAFFIGALRALITEESHPELFKILMSEVEERNGGFKND